MKTKRLFGCLSFIPRLGFCAYYPYPDLMKEFIIETNTGKAGIYMWTHNKSRYRYVGSSVNLGRRFYDYFRKTYLESTQGRSYTNNALLFYGYSAFRLEILEYCEFSSCIEREQYYINLLLPEYNILKTAGSRLGSTHSQETKERISEALKVIKKENNWKGKKHSELSKIKMSEAKKGTVGYWKGKKRPEVSGGRPSIQIEVIDLHTGIQTVYTSMGWSSKSLRCSYRKC